MNVEETAALALAETRPKNKHGQLCPVWVQRMRVKRHAVTIADCDCWILADARRDAAVVLAARPAVPALDVKRFMEAQARAGLRGSFWDIGIVRKVAREYAALRSEEPTAVPAALDAPLEPRWRKLNDTPNPYDPEVHATQYLAWDEGYAAAAPVALDVKRLARALFEADRPEGWPSWDEYLASFGHDLTVDDAWHMRAEAIAREYAALHSEEPTDD